MRKYLPIILILLAIGIFFVIIDPQWNEVKDLQDEKEANNEMLTLAKDLQDKRDRLRNSFNNISTQEKEQLAKLLPDTVDNVRLVLDINNAAEKYGVIIRNITVQSEDEQKNIDSQIITSDLNDDIGTITLGFSITSTYDVFIQFMQDLEEALRIVDIRKLEAQRIVQQSPLGTNTEFLNFNVELDTYWLR